MRNINLEIDLPGAKVVKTEKDQRGNLLITIETTEDHVACRICKKKIYKRHGDDRERQLKHLPAFDHHTFIVYSPHRYVEAVLGVVTKRIASQANWNNVRSLGIDEISLKKGYKIKVLKRRCYGIYNLKHFFQRLFLDLSRYELYAAKTGV